MSETKSHKKLGELFSKHGLRCTKQRVALYEALGKSNAHPTADELFRSLNGKVPAMSLATVYNTLEVFCEVGLAQKLAGAGVNGSARYDAGEDNHPHVRCQRTGKVVDVPADISEQILSAIPDEILERVEKLTGIKINQVQVELIGEDIKAKQQADQEKAEKLAARMKKVKCEPVDEEAYKKGLRATLNPRMPSAK